MKIKNIEIPEVYFYILLLSIGLLIARHVVFNSLLLNLLVTAGLALLMEVAFRVRQRAQVFNQSGKTLEHAAKLTLKQVADLYKHENEKQTNRFNLTGMDR